MLLWRIVNMNTLLTAIFNIPEYYPLQLRLCTRPFVISFNNEKNDGNCTGCYYEHLAWIHVSLSFLYILPFPIL